MSNARANFCTVVACALVVWPTACGGSAGDGVAVRVGTHIITESTVAHRMSVIAPGHVVPDAPRYTACVAGQAALEPQSIATVLKEECRQQYQALRQRALDYLISSQWLIAEARERGLTQAAADANSATEAEQAAARIRQAVISSAPPVTQAEIAAYYRGNIHQLYERPERRYIDIAEPYLTRGAALNAMRKAASGPGIAKAANRSVYVFHEKVDREYWAKAWKRPINHDIFTAKLHTLVGPARVGTVWAFLVVKRAVPALVRPLTRVQAAIAQQLAREHPQRVFVAFIAAWRRKWIARTYCSPGYVVQKCSQYRGSMTPEEPTALN